MMYVADLATVRSAIWTLALLVNIGILFSATAERSGTVACLVPYVKTRTGCSRCGFFHALAKLC